MSYKHLYGTLEEIVEELNNLEKRYEGVDLKFTSKNTKNSFKDVGRYDAIVQCQGKIHPTEFYRDIDDTETFVECCDYPPF